MKKQIIKNETLHFVCKDCEDFLTQPYYSCSDCSVKKLIERNDIYQKNEVETNSNDLCLNCKDGRGNKKYCRIGIIQSKNKKKCKYFNQRKG